MEDTLKLIAQQPSLKCHRRFLLIPWAWHSLGTWLSLGLSGAALLWHYIPSCSIAQLCVHFFSFYSNKTARSWAPDTIWFLTLAWIGRMWQFRYHEACILELSTGQDRHGILYPPPSLLVTWIKASESPKYSPQKSAAVHQQMSRTLADLAC